MTINSYGYTGSIMPNIPWAKIQRVLGSTYAVDGAGDAIVTPVSGGVEVGLGIIGGHGVLDEITDVESVSITAPASGIEYWAICAHRDWQTTNATTMIAVSAGTSLPSALPTAELNDEPGVLDDHPLAIVSISANDTTPVFVWDLRQIGGPNIYSVSDQPPLAMFNPVSQVGTILKRGKLTVTRRVSESSGNAFWDVYPREFFGDEVFPHIVELLWATTGGPSPAAYLSADGTTVDLKIEVRRQAGGNLEPHAPTGGVGDQLIGRVTAPFRPRYERTIHGVYRAGGGATYGCTLRLQTNGDTRLISIAPNTVIPVQQPTAVTLWASDQYTI